ncbi:MAG: RdgB/HAM1 family non-canonical purine NTP pyrophosphatase [Bryobacterales bacterium]|nr:RdgB/HAM1 family non-canonical purine NTP pyrophosphatase [Bryobacterales bacterium]
MILHCATTNAGKLGEFGHAAGELGGDVFRIEALPGVKDIPVPEETGATFEENAVLKALYYSGFSEELVFADDSGLEVDALGGEPGVQSARYSGEGATTEKNNRLLLERLEGAEDRRARFVCVIALARKGEVVSTFRGTVEGEILEEMRGGNGFGYDPLFYCPAFGCTFAEATTEMKLHVSHRGEAVRRMLDFLRR